MTSIVHDFPAIGKHARLKALDGTPQNVVQPMGVDPGVAPVEFDGYGMYAGWTDNAPAVFVSEQGNVYTMSVVDTAPSEWVAPDFDPA